MAGNRETSVAPALDGLRRPLPRRPQHREPLFLALSPRRHARRGRVVHVVFCGHLIDDVQIPSVQDLIVKHAHGRLVLLHSHWYPPLLLSEPLGSAGYITPPVPVSGWTADASKSGMSRAGPKVLSAPGPWAD